MFKNFISLKWIENTMIVTRFHFVAQIPRTNLRKITSFKPGLWNLQQMAIQDVE